MLLLGVLAMRFVAQPAEELLVDGTTADGAAHAVKMICCTHAAVLAALALAIVLIVCRL